MLKIESRGFYLLLCVLMVNLLLKAALLSNLDFTLIGGEIISVLIGALFVGISCMVKGHWSRFSQPNIKTYFIYSLIAAIIVPAIPAVIKYVNVSVLVFNIVVVFVFCFVSSLIIGTVTQKRNAKIDSEFDESSEDK